MKINTIYNCIVLFFLHAFCLSICFQIEDIYSIELNMTNIIIGYSTYWELFLRMLYLSPFIIYYFFKKKEDTESNNFDRVFGLIFAIILLAIVIFQLIFCSYRIITFDLPLKAGLLCVGVNILALCLYYLWVYNQQKFPTTDKTNIIRVCNIFLVLGMLIYSGILANVYTPFKTLQLLNNDKQLDSTIYYMEHLDKIYSNTDEIINKIPDKKQKKNIVKFLKDKHLSYQKIDDNKYKILWKTHLNKQERDNIIRPNIHVPDKIYENNEEIIDFSEKNKLNKKIEQNNKIDMNIGGDKQDEGNHKGKD